MNIVTLLRFLFLFDRQAIQQIADSPRAIWLGLLLVFSAAFAREYDGEYLLQQPWHLLIPAGASIAVAVMLYLLLWLGCQGWRWDTGFLTGLRRFLTLFWMTAPLAWLYALPVERLFDAGDSVRANLWLLAIVATWRVLLTTRVVSVLFHVPLNYAFFPVMLLADTLAAGILFVTPIPIFAVMGGIRLTESERIIQSTTFVANFATVVSWPAWALGTLMFFLRRKKRWRMREPVETRKVSGALWAMGGASLCVWCLVLPFTQVEQHHRWQVETDMRRGDVEAAVRYMADRQRSEFPPHWDPPPRPGYGERKPSTSRVLMTAMRQAPGSWVEDVYLQKYKDSTGDYYRLLYVGEEELEDDITFLESLPEDSPLIERQREELIHYVRDDSAISRRIRKLLKLPPPEF